MEHTRRGMASTDACLETLKRVVKMAEPRLLMPDGRTGGLRDTAYLYEKPK